MNDSRLKNLPRVIYLLFAVFFVLILARAWYLQVTVAEENLQRAGWKTETQARLTAPRGAIWDRHGLPLAESIEAYNLALDPRAFYSQKRGVEHDLIKILSRYDSFDADAFLAMADLPLEKVPRYIRIARGVAPRDVEGVKHAVAALGTNAIIVETAYQRYYPLRGVAGAVLGFVDSEGSAGRAGIERGMNEALEGGELIYSVARDAGRDPYLLGELPDVHAIRGATIELTIDARLQRFAEEALQRTVDRYRAQEAMAVVSNVRTGELLAVATVPTFDPNDPFSHPEEFLWASHALSHAIEPGSTAKILTYAAALNEGAVRPDTLIDCEGGMIRVNDRTIRDTKNADVVPAWKAIQISSNVGSWKIAAALGAEKHREYLERFGIGVRPTVPVAGVATGILPSLRWIDIQHANISFGHGFSASILQMHSAIAAVANGGTRMEPQLIRALRYGDGRVEHIAPQIGAQVVRPEVARHVISAMEAVAYDEGGTGSGGVFPGTRIASKTGTARLVDPEKGGYTRQYMGSYTGFFPADDPKYAITVWVVRPDPALGYYGGEIAAPIFRAIGQEVVRLYGQDARHWAPDLDAAVAALPEGRVEVAKVEERDEALLRPRVVPNLVGLRASEAVALLRERKLPVALHGSGRVATQDPAVGEILMQGKQVILQLAPESMR